MAYKIINNWVASNMYKYKCPYAMKPNYLVIHNTANTASARNEVAYMRRNTNFTSFHAAIDDKEVVQAIPFNRNAFHTGDGINPKTSGNRLAIGIEICYSMDNGYSGAKSARYKKAEANAALYAAHILHQFGWGTDRLRQHWNYTRKDCPHKMRAHNGWNAFVKEVQGHLNEIKGGKKKSNAPIKKSTPAKQQPKKQAPKKKAAPKASAGKFTIGKWKVNKYKTQYAPASGVYVNGNQRVQMRHGSPFTSAKSAGFLAPRASFEVEEICRQSGHLWFKQKGKNIYVPVKTWNNKTGNVGKPFGNF